MRKSYFLSSRARSRAATRPIAAIALALATLGCGGAEAPPVLGEPPHEADAGSVTDRDATAFALDASSGYAPPSDAGLGTAPDAAHIGSLGEGCALGSAGSFATDQSLDLFGNIIYFANGQTLPKGRYRVTYEDGCMKYNQIFLWTINSVAGGTDGWWLVGNSASDRVLVLPGSGGFLPPDAFLTFDECVTTNRQQPPKEFDFSGGKLGIWLNDQPYLDNQAGEGGRNPKWQLTLLVDVCPPEIVLR